MRTYTVIDGDETRVYKGFDRNFNPTPEQITLVSTDGELEVFAEDKNQTHEVVEFLRDRGWDSRLLGTYQRVGLKELTTNPAERGG